MSGEWKAKRFWDAARPVAGSDGWRIELDGREVRTPLKAPLRLPSAALADAVAQEWNAQGDVIAPLTMPLTRASNSAIDKVAPERAGVEELLRSYAETDLICYRAEGPTDLIAEEAAGWDPLLNWAAERFGARLICAQGIMAVTQDPKALERLGAPLRAADNFTLTGAYDLVTLSGSLILALAVAEDHISVDEGWALSRIDERWQERQWGEDAQAAQAAAAKQAQFSDAYRLITLLRKD